MASHAVSSRGPQIASAFQIALLISLCYCTSASVLFQLFVNYLDSITHQLHNNDIIGYYPKFTYSQRTVKSDQRESFLHYLEKTKICIYVNVVLEVGYYRSTITHSFATDWISNILLNSHGNYPDFLSLHVDIECR